MAGMWGQKSQSARRLWAAVPALAPARTCRYGFAMKILYHGVMLRQALRRHGQDVRRLPLRLGGSLREALHDARGGDGWQADLILLELWNQFPLPPDLAQSPIPLAGWCIDAPINRYWVEPLLPLFSVLFADQLSSLPHLAAAPTPPRWLPLCALEEWFRPPRPRTENLLFVGTINALRRKRQHLIARVRERMPLTCLAGLALPEAQDRLAAARLSLNENLFPGVTLRIFQSLAAGSLPFTEKDSPGLDRLLREGEHYLAYTPASLEDQLAVISERPRHWDELGAAAQVCCRRRHSGAQRAGELLDGLRHVALQAPCDFPADRRRQGQLGVALAGQRLAARYGGSVAPFLGILSALSTREDVTGGEALLHFGLWQGRRGRLDKARQSLQRAHDLAAACADGADPKAGTLRLTALLRLAQVLLAAGQATASGRLLDLLEKRIAPPDFPAAPAAVAAASPEAALLLRMAAAAQGLGHAGYPGFLTAVGYRLPESAPELAMQAWQLAPDASVLAFLLDAYAAIGIEQELYPLLLEALSRSLLSDELMWRTARLAEQAYDLPVARRIAETMKACR